MTKTTYWQPLFQTNTLDCIPNKQLSIQQQGQNHSSLADIFHTRSVNLHGALLRSYTFLLYMPSKILAMVGCSPHSQPRCLFHASLEGRRYSPSCPHHQPTTLGGNRYNRCLPWFPFDQPHTLCSLLHRWLKQPRKPNKNSVNQHCWAVKKIQFHNLDKCFDRVLAQQIFRQHTRRRSLLQSLLPRQYLSNPLDNQCNWPMMWHPHSILANISHTLFHLSWQWTNHGDKLHTPLTQC